MNHKICFVGTEITPSDGSAFVGGHVNTVVGLCKGLADLGWEVHIVTTPSRFLNNSEFSFPWAKFHLTSTSRGYNSAGYDFNYLIQALKIIKNLRESEQIELVHGHSGYFGPSIIPVLAKKLLGLPSLFSLYCPASLLPRKLPLNSCGVKALSFGLDKVIAVTANVQESLVKCGVNSERIEVLNSCFDEKAFRNNACHIEHTNRPKAQNKRMVLFVGNAHKTKGLDIFLSAAKLVLRTHPNTKFVITLHEPNKRIQCVRYFASKELGSSVEVLGVIPNMAELMSTADLVVAPFRSTEGISDIPIIVLEAMALGKPVVASNLQGIREAVRHGENGIIIDLGVDELSRAITNLLDNNLLCEKIGSQAVLDAKNFSYSEISKRLSQLYLKVMEA